MKFMCLAYEEEERLDALTLAQWHELRQETLDYVAALQSSGRLLSALPLQSARTASTVRIREGQRAVVDGPFAETKEQIGGFFLIEAADMQEAVDIAAQWPSARIGTIEVRPVEEALRLDSRYGSQATGRQGEP
ncbi:MAG TPA: YciI family protein [Longimicrobiales bacterium]|nr:YciI family protein [Longimicrobiales bacterium]